MKKVLFLFLTLLFFRYGYSQTLDTFISRRYALEFAHQNITRFYWDEPKRGKEPPKDRVSGGDIQDGVIYNSFYLNYKNVKTHKGAKFVEYTNVKMGDWVSLLYRIFFLNQSKPEIVFYEKKIFSSGYLGELNWGRNFYVGNDNKTIISGGINMGDMILPSDYFDLGGYHINAGGFINIEQITHEKWSTSFIGSYSTSIVNLNSSMSGYVNPKTMRFGLNFNRISGTYFGWEFRRVDTNAQRIILKIGYRFNKIGSK